MLALINNINIHLDHFNEIFYDNKLKTNDRVWNVDVL